MNENDLSYEVIGIALDLHRNLGPGLLESAYQAALVYDLIESGFNVRKEVPIPFMYKNVSMGIGYKMDILVEEKLIIEVKSIEILAPVHFTQLQTYLKLSNKKLGLLINFNSKMLKDGIHRIVNGL
ncbi:MAG: GxxExxY protein [Cytophagaceae bacterium]